jgi:hypothetical protein
VLECSAIGSGLIGALVDGSVHATGAKSMIFHGYTVISDNGIGYWIKDAGKAEIVSCFTYYCYFGYASTGGGHIRALNGNNSYGTWGAVSRGFDASETAVTGTLLGQQLNFTYTGGLINVGDTVTSSSGATGIVTNAQYTSDKIYVRNTTGTFSVGNTLTFTSGGTGTVKAGALENQKGFILVMNGLTAAPKPGQSIQLAGDSFAYVVQSVSGTYTNASSEIVVVLSQEKPTGSPSGTAVTLRSKYSQIRLTGHDFLSIGTGGVTTTNYPGTPTQPPAQGNETDENFPGRVFYVSTDQDGNFRVGEYFRIDQATGRATLNASAFDLAGLTSLRLGSIGAQLGETINEFSSDATMSGNSNTAVPTEYAVKTYTDQRVLKAGDTMTGTLTLPANGLVVGSGTNQIRVTNDAVGFGVAPIANNGVVQLGAHASIEALIEVTNVVASAPASTTNFDLMDRAVQYHTTNTANNWTLNIRGNASTTLNSIMQVGQSVTVAFLVTNGGSAYYQTGFTVDGSSVTVRWSGANTPTQGNANSIDAYSITVIKTANATFTALGALTRFA